MLLYKHTLFRMFCLLFYNISVIIRSHLCGWKAATSRPLLGRDLSRSTPALTTTLVFLSVFSRWVVFSWNSCTKHIFVFVLRGPVAALMYRYKVLSIIVPFTKVISRSRSRPSTKLFLRQTLRNRYESHEFLGFDRKTEVPSQALDCLPNACWCVSQ